MQWQPAPPYGGPQALGPAAPGSPAFHVPDISSIYRGIWIGGRAALRSGLLNERGIEHVLNTSEELLSPSTPVDWADLQMNGILIQHVRWLDTEQQRIFPLAPDVHEALQFIHECVEAGQPILVNCQMGVSRSSSMVITYLIVYHRLSFPEALRLVRAGRPIASPNLGFSEQLAKLASCVAQGIPIGMPLPTPAKANGLPSPVALRPSEPPRKAVPATEGGPTVTFQPIPYQPIAHTPALQDKGYSQPTTTRPATISPTRDATLSPRGRKSPMVCQPIPHQPSTPTTAPLPQPGQPGPPPPPYAPLGPQRPGPGATLPPAGPPPAIQPFVKPPHLTAPTSATPPPPPPGVQAFPVSQAPPLPLTAAPLDLQRPPAGPQAPAPAIAEVPKKPRGPRAEATAKPAATPGWLGADLSAYGFRATEPPSVTVLPPRGPSEPTKGDALSVPLPPTILTDTVASWGKPVNGLPRDPDPRHPLNPNPSLNPNPTPNPRPAHRNAPNGLHHTSSATNFPTHGSELDPRGPASRLASAPPAALKRVRTKA